eukprot:TRINITY_DN8432_c0_g2_i1.p1 TRINITY_DN8432_c0_g2~~TRINITY_DN8432_c0_g2_i1.p1  ORF type:complete len:455 (+),score=96.56 TRINITY_DN8432_c0_g2_i1:47-1366(+)
MHVQTLLLASVCNTLIRRDYLDDVRAATAWEAAGADMPTGTIEAGPTSYFQMNATWAIIIAARDNLQPLCPQGRASNLSEGILPPAAQYRDVTGAHQKVLLTHCITQRNAAPSAPRRVPPRPTTTPVLGVCMHRVEIANPAGVLWIHSWVDHHLAEMARAGLKLGHVTMYTMKGLRPSLRIPHLWVSVNWVLKRLDRQQWVTLSRPYQKWAYWDCLFRYYATTTMTHVLFADPDEVFHFRIPLAPLLARADGVGFTEVMYAGTACRGNNGVATVQSANYGLANEGDGGSGMEFRGKYIVTVQPPADYWGLAPRRFPPQVKTRFCSLDIHWPNWWSPAYWGHGKKEVRRSFAECQRSLLVSSSQAWMGHVRGVISSGGQCRNMSASCIALTGKRLPSEKQKSGLIVKRHVVGDECVVPSDPRAAWFWGGPEGAGRVKTSS